MKHLFTLILGQTLFRPTDPDRTPLTVIDTTTSYDHRHRIAILQPPADTRPTTAHPQHLVHTDPALRPTDDQLTGEIHHLTRWITSHHDACNWCARSSFWGCAYRCSQGRQQVSELLGVNYYRDNVLPWLAGGPADPARLRGGQTVTVYTGGGEFVGRVANVRPGGTWHEPGQDGMVCVFRMNGHKLADDGGPHLYPAASVFNRP